VQSFLHQKQEEGTLTEYYRRLEMPYYLFEGITRPEPDHELTAGDIEKVERYLIELALKSQQGGKDTMAQQIRDLLRTHRDIGTLYKRYASQLQ
jgi:hypothetical protein